MEQIINNMVNDQELAKLILDSVNKLNNLHHLLLKGGTSFWEGDKYVYSFIFKDTSDIATLEMPVYKMITEEAKQCNSGAVKITGYLDYTDSPTIFQMKFLKILPYLISLIH